MFLNGTFISCYMKSMFDYFSGHWFGGMTRMCLYGCVCFTVSLLETSTTRKDTRWRGPMLLSRWTLRLTSLPGEENPPSSGQCIELNEHIHTRPASLQMCLLIQIQNTWSVTSSANPEWLRIKVWTQETSVRSGVWFIQIIQILLEVSMHWGTKVWGLIWNHKLLVHFIIIKIWTLNECKIKNKDWNIIFLYYVLLSKTIFLQCILNY